MIILIHAEKVFNKTYHSLMIKKIHKLRIEDKLPQPDKGHLFKKMLQLTSFMGTKLNAITLRPEKKTRMIHLTIPIQDSTRSPS
jgi:hypothetical protein